MWYKKYFTRIFICSLLLGSADISASSDKSYHVHYKPHAPIDMVFEVEGDNITINQLIKIKVVFKNRVDVDDLIINLQANNNLKIFSDKKLNFGMQPKNKSNTIMINAIVKEQGTIYINVLATMLKGNQQQSRSFSIPVNVKSIDGLPAKILNRSINEIKSTNGIISMPAIKK